MFFPWLDHGGDKVLSELLLRFQLLLSTISKYFFLDYVLTVPEAAMHKDWLHKEAFWIQYNVLIDRSK